MNNLRKRNSTKDEIKEMSQIGKDYVNCKKSLKTNNYSIYTWTKNEAEKIVDNVDRILKSFDEPFVTILSNSFFKENYRFWWVDYYSRATFYRNREKAVLAFLFAYHQLKNA